MENNTYSVYKSVYTVKMNTYSVYRNTFQTDF